MSQVSPQPKQAAQGPEASRADGAAAPLSLEALVLAQQAAVYRYAFRLTGRSADAEDLTQQTFLIAQQKLHQLRETERAGGWLLAIARTTWLKSLAKRFPATCDGDLAETPAPAREILEIDSQELQQVLDELSAELRLTLAMFYFDELSYKEIADQLEIPIGTVMSRLSRAKQRLRERLGACVPGAPTPRKDPVSAGPAVNSPSTPTVP